MRSRRRRIWLAKISRIDRHPAQLTLLHAQFGQDVKSVLDPNHRHSYYGREWRLSQPHIDAAAHALYCKLGFARRSRPEEVDYIESEHDWITVEAPAKTGDYSHFVIDLSSQVMAFEEKGPDLSRRSFLNALSLFLADAGYEVNLIADAADFDTWLADVDRVTRFYVTLKPPNPGWSRRAKETRKLAEEIAADRLSIEATSKDSVNVRDTLLQGAADTAAMGNGEFRASGFKGGARRFFDSTKRFLSGDIDVSDHASSATILTSMRELMVRLEADMPGAAGNDGNHDAAAGGEGAIELGKPA